ncbi:MAG TPA: hypothetical protein VMF50_14185 [Candidatus Binataceae bacterium]|nr:hypothetical protein [Candidatus Binataceae bacterium]
MERRFLLTVNQLLRSLDLDIADLDLSISQRQLMQLFGEAAIVSGMFESVIDEDLVMPVSRYRFVRKAMGRRQNRMITSKSVVFVDRGAFAVTLAVKIFRKANNIVKIAPHSGQALRDIENA